MRYIALALQLLFVFAACQEKPEPEAEAPVIRIKTTEVSLDSDGASENIAYVIENEIEGEKISVTCEAEWLKVNTDKARIITLSAQTNETGEVRKTEVVLS